jgi:hypothetical protein
LNDAAPLGAVVVAYLPGPPERFVPCLRSLERHGGAPVVAGGPGAAGLPSGLAAERHPDASVADLVGRAWERHRTHILLVCDPILVPPAFLMPALGIVADDIRAGTVSFFSNTAGYLSFPDGPARRLLEGHDEISITRSLRSLGPAAAPVGITPCWRSF